MKRLNPASVTNAELIKELKDLSIKLKRTPSQADMRKYGIKLTKRLHLYRQRFGSIQGAQEIAGLEANKSGNNLKYTERELLDELSRLYLKLNKVPTALQLEKYPVGAYKRHFGTYNNAIKRLNMKVNRNTDNIKTLVVSKKSLISTKAGCLDKEILVYDGNKLTSSFIKTLSLGKKEEIVNDLFNFFIKRDFYIPIIDEQTMVNQFAGLKDKNIDVKDGLITKSPNSGNKIYKHFFPNIMEISTKSNKSVLDVVSDKVLLRKVIRNRLGIGYKETFNITTNMIKQGAKSTGLAAHGSQFKPLIAKAIYDKFVKEGDNVLDYSCGFGSRLLGLMATNKSAKYFGYEPNTKTYNNLIKMAKYFNFDISIKNHGSELDLFNKKFDFIFSSPPYFDHEIYCDEVTQSSNKFKNYDEWLEGYWRKTVKNISKMSKPSTVLGVNAGSLNNDKMSQIYHDMMGIVKEEGFKLIETWNMEINTSHFNKKGAKNKKLEPICFYKMEE